MELIAEITPEERELIKTAFTFAEDKVYCDGKYIVGTDKVYVYRKEINLPKCETTRDGDVVKIYGAVPDLDSYFSKESRTTITLHTRWFLEKLQAALNVANSNIFDEKLIFFKIAEKCSAFVFVGKKNDDIETFNITSNAFTGDEIFVTISLNRLVQIVKTIEEKYTTISFSYDFAVGGHLNFNGYILLMPYKIDNFDFDFYFKQ